MKMHHSFIKQPSYFEMSVSEVNALIAEAEKLSGKSCPFCGGEATASLVFVWRMTPSISIRCDNCGVRTPHLCTGKMASGKEYTAKDRLYQALSVWNKRAYDET